MVTLSLGILYVYGGEDLKSPLKWIPKLYATSRSGPQDRTEMNFHFYE